MAPVALVVLVLTLSACTPASPSPPATDVVTVDVADLANRLDRLHSGARATAERFEQAVRAGRQQQTLLLSRLRRVEDLVPAEYQRLVIDVAERHGLDPRLLAALVHVESGWDPQARGSAGEIGLTQILPETARWIAEARGRPIPDLADPLESLDAGAWYLTALLRETGGNAVEALARYNGGPRWRDRAPVAARIYSERVVRLAAGRGN